LSELLQRVLDRPDDEGLRLVYADWLQERGDPRGELIILQLQKRKAPLTEEESARESALIEAHVDAWQGKLARITQFVEFEGGFLHACSLREVPVWASRQREWRTVRHLGVQRDARFLGALLESEHLEGLRSLRVSDECMSAVFAHAPPGVTKLVVDGNRFEVKELFTSPKLAGVQTLELRYVRQKLVFERLPRGWSLSVSLRKSPWAYERKHLPPAFAKLPPGLVQDLKVDPPERAAEVRKALGVVVRR
jgi:uncharacterized protein (TIGR02996 family)